MNYDEKKAAKFCEALASSTDSIATLCKRQGMPSKATVFRWKDKVPEFATMFKEAQSDRVDTLFDECVEIADKCTPDKASVQKARLQIHIRIETAQRLKPKEYGVRTQLTGDGGGPVKVSVKDYTGRKKAGDDAAD